MNVTTLSDLVAGSAVIRVNDSDKREFDLFKAELAKERGAMVTQEGAFRELMHRARAPNERPAEKLKPPAFF